MMTFRKRTLPVALFFLLFCGAALPVRADCWFLRDEKIETRTNTKPFRIGELLIHAPDAGAVYKQQETLRRSVHFLQTQLGWKFPYTRKDFNQPVLEIFFVDAEPDFTGTVRTGPVLVLNEKVLKSPDFGAIWIHYLSHAAELMYRNTRTLSRDYWFYESTAGWMEGQFGSASARTRLAQNARLTQPEIPIDSASPELALGSSYFLQLVARPYRDVVRQTWEQWSFSGEEKVMDVLSRVLQLNHLPPLRSYLLNYYLRTVPPDAPASATTIVLQPYSATVVQGNPDGTASGGIHLSFRPEAGSMYSAAAVYHGSNEREGILTMKETLRDAWSVQLPFSNMAKYRMVIVNASAKILRGEITKRYDSTIPAVLEYFRATPGDDGSGVQLEWRTSRENGVAFWNVYRIQNGARERLNSLPIPATLDSPTGLNYVFVDYTTGSFYSLEAITDEGFPSQVATTETQNHN